MAVRGRPTRPAGLRRRLYRAPILLYRAGIGGLLGSRFVLVHHVGRNSGRQHRTVLEIVRRDGDAVTVAAGFGSGSDWYRNLLAHSRTSVEIGCRRLAVTAHQPGPEERADAMLDYAGRHPGAARRLAKVMRFSVGGGEPDYRTMGRAIYMIRFAPDRPADDPAFNNTTSGEE